MNLCTLILKMHYTSMRQCWVNCTSLLQATERWVKELFLQFNKHAQQPKYCSTLKFLSKEFEYNYWLIFENVGKKCWKKERWNLSRSEHFNGVHDCQLTWHSDLASIGKASPTNSGFWSNSHGTQMVAYNLPRGEVDTQIGANGLICCMEKDSQQSSEQCGEKAH